MVHIAQEEEEKVGRSRERQEEEQEDEKEEEEKYRRKIFTQSKLSCYIFIKLLGK